MRPPGRPAARPWRPAAATFSTTGAAPWRRAPRPSRPARRPSRPARRPPGRRAPPRRPRARPPPRRAPPRPARPARPPWRRAPRPWRREPAPGPAPAGAPEPEPAAVPEPVPAARPVARRPGRPRRTASVTAPTGARVSPRPSALAVGAATSASPATPRRARRLVARRDVRPNPIVDSRRTHRGAAVQAFDRPHRQKRTPGCVPAHVMSRATPFTEPCRDVNGTGDSPRQQRTLDRKWRVCRRGHRGLRSTVRSLPPGIRPITLAAHLPIRPPPPPEDPVSRTLTLVSTAALVLAALAYPVLLHYVR